MATTTSLLTQCIVSDFISSRTSSSKEDKKKRMKVNNLKLIYSLNDLNDYDRVFALLNSIAHHVGKAFKQEICDEIPINGATWSEKTDHVCRYLKSNSSKICGQDGQIDWELLTKYLLLAVFILYSAYERLSPG